MMTNLFSIFDPSTPNFFSSNWISALIPLLLLPPVVWAMPVRWTQVIYLTLSFLFKEFFPLLKKSAFVLIMALALFFFISLNNIMGLAPYIFTATTQLVFTAALAIPLWLTLMLYGWLNNPSNLLIHLIPQSTPLILMPFMVLIETISNIIRPLTLTMRLTANMVAGHLLITLLNSMDFTPPLLATPLLFIIKQLLLLLEIAVAIIQAYVFSVLMTLYAAEFTN
uniref:ATP synthase subunit a n=1 Tax=Gammarus pisinnus TaxID=1486748 RepID=A0A517LS60_9CRUS|nr:ATP synthase F0 subunit 6 [Gammarus pisinnus]QDS78467.1 ATP synthase F0 subunit 6 [Gammarus pisinnus]